MKSHCELSDEEFIEKFADCSLIPQLFDHEAHLRLAWIHISKYGEERAVENICSQIKKFDQVHGDGSKYHETITVAAIKAVYHFYNKSETTTFSEFIAENPRLKYNLGDLLEQHYGFDIFSSEDAKNSYLKPDLAPFD